MARAGVVTLQTSCPVEAGALQCGTRLQWPRDEGILSGLRRHIDLVHPGHTVVMHTAKGQIPVEFSIKAPTGEVYR